MEDSTNPKKSNFIEDLQKASEEIEAGSQRKKASPSPAPEISVKETRGPNESLGGRREGWSPSAPPSARGFDQDLRIQAEEVAKEKKRLEEIQKNLTNHQKMVAECLQKLTTIEGEISKVLESKKKIDEDLRGMREKNQKIFEDLKDFNPFQGPAQGGTPIPPPPSQRAPGAEAGL